MYAKRVKGLVGVMKSRPWWVELDDRSQKSENQMAFLHTFHISTFHLSTVHLSTFHFYSMYIPDYIVLYTKYIPLYSNVFERHS